MVSSLELKKGKQTTGILIHLVQFILNNQSELFQ
jgi:hypothetical protein